jgi:hypothetical protein
MAWASNSDDSTRDDRPWDSSCGQMAAETPFRSSPVATSHPLDILKLIAHHKGQRLEDATVILVIDGLHRLMDTYEDAQRDRQIWQYQEPHRIVKVVYNA